MFVSHATKDNTFAVGGVCCGGCDFTLCLLKVVWPILKSAEHLQTSVFTYSRENEGKAENVSLILLLKVIIRYCFFKQEFWLTKSTQKRLRTIWQELQGERFLIFTNERVMQLLLAQWSHFSAYLKTGSWKMPQNVQVWQWMVLELVWQLAGSCRSCGNSVALGTK